MKELILQKLYTKEGEALTGIPWEHEYPRPMMRREKWMNLNGDWTFFSSVTMGTTIKVPFCPESLLSGVGKQPEYGETLRYERTFIVPEDWADSRILLHFGAVMRETEVFVNRTSVCCHDNGYLPFFTDVTDALVPGENVLRVLVKNDLSPEYPWGKQTKKRGGMWYTPCSGIWQTVWMEPVPVSHIEKVSVAQDMTGADVFVEGVTEGVIEFEGKTVPLENGKARLCPKEPLLWTPESPHLYEFTVKSGDDEVRSYFALRTITAEEIGGKVRLCLNKKPYFFNGLLDQGYFSDGLYTPAVPELYEQDILRMKSLGFNMLRKHIKVEPERFYYDCDRLGMVVFQDMVNNSVYHYIKETVLPTIKITCFKDRFSHRNPKTRKQFIKDAKATIMHLKSHPSILCWTIFNEGWGQFCSDQVYEELKALDPDRIFDSTSGWFHQKKSDVDSMHNYFHELTLGKNRALPQVLSEFGGYVYKIPEHSMNLSKTYGYKVFETQEAHNEALKSLYTDHIVPLAKEGLSASVYTQVSDVEDETNGLLTFDRRVMKTSPKDLEGVGEALQDAVKE